MKLGVAGGWGGRGSCKSQFCDLGCATPSEVDDLQIFLNSMLVKGFSAITEDQTWSTCVCQTRTSHATLAFLL